MTHPKESPEVKNDLQNHVQPSIGCAGHEIPSFLKSVSMLGLALAPISFVALILSVAIHELIGHGLVSLAVGGRFTGFALMLDGMGWAITPLPENCTTLQYCAIMMGGIASTTVLGIFAAVVSIYITKNLFTRCILLIVAGECLFEGSPYLFWNAYHPHPPGDVAAILNILDNAGFAFNEELRWCMMFVGGVIYLATTILLPLLLFQVVEAFIRPGKRSDGLQRVALLVFFVALPGSVGWFTFDWNQLAEGIGDMPCYVGASSFIIIAVILHFYSLKPLLCVAHVRVSMSQVVISWLIALMLALIIALYLKDGVHWGSA